MSLNNFDDGPIINKKAAVSLLVAALFIAWLVWFNTARVNDDKALIKFQEMADTQNVEIVGHSNSHFAIGNPWHVNYQLMVDGKLESGECSSGYLSPQICRLYSGH